MSLIVAVVPLLGTETESLTTEFSAEFMIKLYPKPSSLPLSHLIPPGRSGSTGERKRPETTQDPGKHPQWQDLLVCGRKEALVS